MERNFFISYRRQTSIAFAGALFDHLQSLPEAGEVFLDRDAKSLPAGEEWPKELISRVLRADVILVIIDRHWTEELAKRNRREGAWIKDTECNDWVRREVMFGLHFGKMVIPLLIDGAEQLKETDLPYDLQKLAPKNALRINSVNPDFAPLDHNLTEIREAAPVHYDPPSEFQAGRQSPDNDLNSKFGQGWHPNETVESPHRWDYKYVVTDPDRRMQIRTALLASRRSGMLESGFTLADLSDIGEHRCFAHSEKKSGMFLQASCIVTDGRKGKIENLLMTHRHHRQFHDEVYEDAPIESNDENKIRFTKGESCLIGTCLSDFTYHDETAHLSKAVFNDLNSFNPWAVFSRKLLIPALFVDSRFFGVGYNLNNPDKEYVHFIWHVRTNECPEAMLVPAREKVKYDVPRWEPLTQVKHYDFEGCGIDRLATESLLNVSLPLPECENDGPTVFHGFAKFNGLEGTQGTRANQPKSWRREAIPIDLIRMFQQTRHSEIDTSKIEDEIALKDSLSRYLTQLAGTKDFTIDLAEGSQANELIVSLTDSDGEETTCFRVLHFVTDHQQLEERVIDDIRDDALRVLSNGNTAAATLVVQGVKTSQRYTLNGAELLSSPGGPAIHVIKIALRKPVRALKRVVHAIIPVRSGSGDQAEHCLFTRHEGDETQRLPGGKIENAETPEQALVRELKEELDLDFDEFTIQEVILPKGRTSTEVSPSSGEFTDYQLIPILVAPKGTGIEKLQRHLRGEVPDEMCRLWIERLDDWATSGFGFDKKYANETVERVSLEALNAAAFLSDATTS